MRQRGAHVRACIKRRRAYGMDQAELAQDELALSLDSIISQQKDLDQMLKALEQEVKVLYERDGGEIRNGSDLPRIARANKILDLARSYGIEVSEFDDQAVHVSAPSDTYHY